MAGSQPVERGGKNVLDAKRPGMSIWEYLGIAVGVLVLLNVAVVALLVVVYRDDDVHDHWRG